MSDIPVHVQRSFEQRWAAKLASSGASAAPKSVDLKGTVNSLLRPQEQNKSPLRTSAGPVSIQTGRLDSADLSPQILFRSGPLALWRCRL